MLSVGNVPDIIRTEQGLLGPVQEGEWPERAQVHQRYEDGSQTTWSFTSSTQRPYTGPRPSNWQVTLPTPFLPMLPLHVPPAVFTSPQSSKTPDRWSSAYMQGLELTSGGLAYHPVPFRGAAILTLLLPSLPIFSSQLHPWENSTECPISQKVLLLISPPSMSTKQGWLSAQTCHWRHFTGASYLRWRPPSASASVPTALPPTLPLSF